MPLSRDRMHEITEQMGRSSVLILGDIMLDEYYFGSVERISPEAPVPVVEISSTKILLGGAANVAANVRALGDSPLLIGTVGEDNAALKFQKLLNERGISQDHIVVDKTRQTTIKTRIIAHSQQVVRADREDRHPLSDDIENEIMSHLEKLAPKIAAVIISDYGKGVITKSLLAKVIPFCKENKIFIAVDPKDANFFSYQHVSLITPNHHEAGFAFGRRISNEEDLLIVGNGLLEKLQARSILITRGAEGMSLFQVDRPATHIPTFARKVFDVTGAGDTVICGLCFAVSAGADLIEAAIIANAAAGYTVGEIGTATIGIEQLTLELERHIKDGNLKRVAAH